MRTEADQGPVSPPRLRPRVSVVIPTYRGQDTIISTLESVFLQTFQDFEVIVVNDGSPDATARLLAPLAASGRTRYLEQPNQGQAAARNRGLAEATGEFTAFLDDDDLWPPDKLEWQIAYLDKHPSIAAVGGGHELIDDSIGNTILPYEGAITAEMLSHGNPFVSPGQTLIRTHVLREMGGFDTSLWGTDDMDLWFRLALNAKIVACRQNALRYRIHEQNASRDVILLYLNGFRMIRKHLRLVPAETLAVIRKNYYVWLYNYLGPSVVRCVIKRPLKSCQGRGSINRRLNLTSVLMSLISSPTLGWLFVQETMIAVVRKMLRRLRTAELKQALQEKP
jgi:glycosyltransferase involved in cell wall biosynthesis